MFQNKYSNPSQTAGFNLHPVLPTAAFNFTKRGHMWYFYQQ